MKRSVLALLFLATSSLAGGRIPVPMVLDTDMGNDVDDVMALAMIHALERRGACRLLAVTTSKDHPKSAAFIDAVNTFYGRPDVPIGAIRGGPTPLAGKLIPLLNETRPGGGPLYPHGLRDGSKAPPSVETLRRTLANQPDGSVTVVQIGFASNLARLLNSDPDELSDLDGVELVRAKVHRLVVMAGAFQQINFATRPIEHNARLDVPSMQTVARKWPTRIVWSGSEIGMKATFPWRSIMQDLGYGKRKHIVRESYLAFAPGGHQNRPGRDLSAVLYATFPDRDYFDVSPRGVVNVENDGATLFRPHAKGRHQYLLVKTRQLDRIIEAFTQLVTEPPGKPVRTAKKVTRD